VLSWKTGNSIGKYGFFKVKLIIKITYFVLKGQYGAFQNLQAEILKEEVYYLPKF
jgi:hypothetical protein